MPRKPKLSDWLERYVSAGLSRDEFDSGEQQRYRLIRIASLVLFVFGLCEAIVVTSQGAPILAACVAAATLLYPLNSWWLQRTRRVDRAACVLCAIVYAGLVGSATQLGGLRSTAFEWLALLPMLAGVVSGSRGTALGTGIVMLTALGFWGAELAGAALPDPLPLQQDGVHLLFDCISATAAAGMLSWAFLFAGRRAEIQLQRASVEIRRESRSVELLRRTATAANASTSPEAALRVCLREVCRFTGWPVGHAYLLGPDARLITSGLWSLDDPERYARIVAASNSMSFAPGVGLPGRVLAGGQPEWIENVMVDPNFPCNRAGELGVRAGIGLPVLADGEVVAVLEFFHPEALARDPGLLDLLGDVGSQLGRVFERERAASRIRSLAYYDGLTQLPNRRLFQENLERGLRRARRDATGMALLFLDLDSFKHVNDSLGHDVGDQLLCEVARRLRRAVRTNDVVARNLAPGADDGNQLSRLGGDEFTILLPEIQQPQDAAQVAQRALAVFSEPIEVAGSRVFGSASIGIALYPHDGEDSGTLLSRADTAMYAAKQEGGGYRFFDVAMNRESARRIEMGAWLREALERDRFELHFQPICDAATGAVHSAEALIRMRGPDGTLVPPDQFIPVAEEIGLIGPIGEWVLRSACRRAVEWREELGRPLRVAVNVSVQQIASVDFVATVARALRDAGLPAEGLELEITESTIMRDDAPTRAAVQGLRALGLQLTLDDFGTGYSSLSYLRRFPLSRIKIDRSFISDIPGNQADVTLTSAILALAQSLGLRAVAEGVETEEQLAFLRRHGCSDVQGYLLGRPLPHEPFAEYLRKHFQGEP